MRKTHSEENAKYKGGVNMDCPVCRNEMGYEEPVYSNYNSTRATKGEQTGEVYRCANCQETYLDDWLSGKLYIWHY